MKSVFISGLPAAVVSACYLLGAAAPVQGVWEGREGGAKAITLNVHDRGDRIEGTAVFYVLHDGGSGTHSGSASPEIPLSDPKWDGSTLRFAIHGPHGESGVFEMSLTGERTAEIRLLRDGKPEKALRLERLR